MKFYELVFCLVAGAILGYVIARNNGASNYLPAILTGALLAVPVFFGARHGSKLFKKDK